MILCGYISSTPGLQNYRELRFSCTSSSCHALCFCKHLQIFSQWILFSKHSSRRDSLQTQVRLCHSSAPVTPISPSSDSHLAQSPSQKSPKALPCLVPLPWDLRVISHPRHSASATLASPSLNTIFTPCSRAFVPAVPLPVIFFPQTFSGLLPYLLWVPVLQPLGDALLITARHFPPPSSAFPFIKVLSTTRNSVCLAYSLISVFSSVELQEERDFCSPFS